MMSGLNSYDYGARLYYSVMPAWDRVDPLCEKFYNISPYAYFMNNPVNKIDLYGLKPGVVYSTLDSAVVDFGNYTNPKSVKNKREYSTAFYKTKDKNGNEGYSYTKPKKGNALGHTHGAYKRTINIGNDVFGGLDDTDNILGKHNPKERMKIKNLDDDIGISNVWSIPFYLVTPNGSIQHYDNSAGEIRIFEESVNKYLCDPNDPYKIIDIKKYYGKE